MHAAVRGEPPLITIMLAVEKIRRIAEIKRKRLEAVAAGRIPSTSIPSHCRIALPRRTRCDSPDAPAPAAGPSGENRNCPSAACGAPIGRALPLRLGRQRLAGPARVGAGFGVAHVHRPVERQRRLRRTSCAASSASAFAVVGESRRPDARCARLPSTPSLRRSSTSRFAVAAGIDEPQIVAVRHHVAVDLERGHVDALFAELVVPAEPAAFARQAERRAAGRHADHFERKRRDRRRRLRARIASVAILLSQRQLMQHVRERFGVHQPMLDRDFEQLRGRFAGGIAARRRSRVGSNRASISSRTAVA